MTPKKFTKKYEGYLHALVQSGPKIKLPSCFPEMEFIGCSFIGDYVSRKGPVIFLDHLPGHETRYGPDRPVI